MNLRFTIIVGIAALAGCDDSGFEPLYSKLEGRYVLESVNRAALPAIDADNEYVRRTVIADTLAFMQGGVAESSIAIRVWEKLPDRTTTTVNQSTQKYRVHGHDRGRIVFEFVCPDNAMCLGRFMGRLSSDGSTLTTGVSGAETYRYRRIS